MPDRAPFTNAILSRLPGPERDRILPHLEPIDLPQNFVIAEPDQPIGHVYFPEEGIGSIVCISPEGEKAEAGMFGREGFAPMPPLARSGISLNLVTMQGPGFGHRLSVSALWELLPSCPALSEWMMKFALNLGSQVAFTALSNAVHSVDERLAKWLLMAHDRVSGNELNLTHEYLSIMLAVRRPSVTTSLHVLEGNGFIKSERKLITIRNRSGLEEFAHDAYGRPEQEYHRLFSRVTP